MAVGAAEVVQGFSLTNRWLLYASLMLTPAQFLSGIGSNCPSNLGFLAYNWYNQIVWLNAVRAKKLHALSLLPVHFNLIYAITYLGGVTCGNIIMGLVLGLGTAGVMILNTFAAWESWKTNQIEGFGEYKFFFFGWRTLSEGWHKFILVWQIADTLGAFSCVIGAIVIPFTSSSKAVLGDSSSKTGIKRFFSIENVKYPAIPLGAAAMLFVAWPLILWVELIVQKNKIQSETDWISVWLFVAQVGALLMPSCSACLPSWRGRNK